MFVCLLAHPVTYVRESLSVADVFSAEIFSPVLVFWPSQQLPFWPTSSASASESTCQIHQPSCANCIWAAHCVCRKWCQTVSPTKLLPTVQVHTTRIYDQLVCHTAKNKYKLQVHERMPIKSVGKIDPNYHPSVWPHSLIRNVTTEVAKSIIILLAPQ